MQKPKIIEFKHNQEEVSKLLGIEQKELDLRYPIQIISVGKEKLLVPLLSLAGLLKINPDLKGIKEYCKKSGANGFFLFTKEDKDVGNYFHARHFNPLILTEEDPIYGVGSGALGAYLKMNKLINKKQIFIKIGQIMNKQGEVFVDLSSGIKIGGHAVKFGEK